jgi:sec-independent protein translocase protein TatA
VIGDILQPTHLLFILVIALLVLGPKRLPEVGRSLGRGLRDFRTAVSGHDEEPPQQAIEGAQNGEGQPPQQTMELANGAEAPPPIQHAAPASPPVHEAANVSAPAQGPAPVSSPAQEPASVSAERDSTGSA